MTHKERYRDFYDSLENPPLFLAPWYLDAVARYDWQVTLSHDKDRINGAMVFDYDKRFKKELLSLPFMPAVNVLMDINKAKSPANQRSEERKILETLFSKLPDYDRLNLKLGSHIIDWRPILWSQPRRSKIGQRKYNQTTRYTSTFSAHHTIDAVRAGYKSSLRSQIKKAKKYLTVSDAGNTEDFLQLIKSTYDRKNDEMTFEEEHFIRWYKAVEGRGVLRKWLAYKADDLVGGILCVEDHDCLYYLFGGVEERYKKYASQSLLMDSAIAYSLARGIKFDFEGSMNQGIDYFFMKFNPEIVPYYEISHTPNIFLRLYQSLK